MEEYAKQMSRSFENELQKIAEAKLAGNWLLPLAAGSVLTAAALRAERDRKLGRRLRIQQGG
jgi:hypothetical protein